MLSTLPISVRDRCRRLNTRRVNISRIDAESTAYVLCWLQQAIRGVDNPAVDAAIAIANRHDVPVLVYHGIDNRYPFASERLHTFLLQASRSLERDLDRRGLRLVRHVRTDPAQRRGPRDSVSRRSSDGILPSRVVDRLARRSIAVVTDDVPAFMGRANARRLADRLDVPVIAVDAARLVPGQAFDQCLSATKSFRAAHRPLRTQWLARRIESDCNQPRLSGRLPVSHDAIDARHPIDDWVSRAAVDSHVAAVDFDGDRDAGLDRLRHAVENVVARYKWTRNNPSLADSTSKLSPYLHFGVISPGEVVAAVEAAELHPAARWKFFDELLTWREYYHHLADHAEHASSYDNVPSWARQTLAAHAADPRPTIYSDEALLNAETDDPVWNAAQRQFLLDGWMHNNLRMYWVKQFLKWTSSPHHAWSLACSFNDRLSLDGRDPSTYGGIQWGFGRSRRGYRELPIYGWVPPKSSSAIVKRAGMAKWIEEMNDRECPRIDMHAGKWLRMYR